MLSSDIEKRIHKKLRSELKEKGCFVKAINGMEDHVHLLFNLNKNYSLASVVKHIKGSTSHWINQNQITKQRFSWQKGYSANSVSEKSLEDAYWYVIRQKEHHRKISAQK